MRSQLQAFEDAIQRRITFPQYIANTLIGLGLFGTFLGLIVTLKEVAGLIGVFAISGNLDSADMMGQFFQKMSGPLAGMGEAFVASLLGLGGSIVNNLQLLSLKKLQATVVNATEASYFDVAEIIYGPPTTDAEGKQVALDVRLAQLQLEEIAGLRMDISKQTDAILIAAAKMRLASESMGKTMEMLERVATQEDMRPNFDRLAIVMEQRLNTIVGKLDDSQMVHYSLLNVAKDYSERFGQISQNTDQIIHHITSQLAELSALRRDISEADALGRGHQQQTIDSLKEAIHRDMGLLAAAMAENVRILREQNQTLIDINSQSMQANLQLKAMEAGTRRAIEHVQPQIVEMIARLEKTEQTHEYVAKYDWGQLHTKVDKLQASLNSGKAPLRS
ncbi:MotA/TolQ/ExbB proton channel family protein [Limnohabitans sp.]|uniref:MotA/TolQ/ExbB proton channel family protein n=1 Tax=Limnohabitans sp. TaxID=1907725 RepID=UPI00286F6B35|nr:MotA/TolQ/ExbB proton channel family protein [Limnohabitans sp.]